MLAPILSPLSGRVYVVLRILAGALLAFHGAQKVFGLHSDKQPEVFSQLWIGGVIELVCGAMVVIGLKTRWAAFLLSGTMAVAYTQFHWKLRLDENFFPTVNGGELALVYCFLFLYIACHGSGRAALESKAD